MAKKDYYEILGVSETASSDEIRKVYRELAKKYHPDRHPGDKTAEEKFKEISEAHSVLSDPKKRAQYDQMRKLGAFSGSSGGNYDFRGFDFGDLSNVFTSGRGRRSKKRSFSFEDFGGFGGLGDLFSQFFDSSSERPPKQESRSDDNLYLEIRVPFELATSGGKMQFSYQRKVICKHCNGNGTEPGSKSQTCPNCNGTGTVSSGLGGFVVNRPCPQCLGRGTIISNPCKVCGGAGSINETRTLAIPLKPGTEDGKKIKLRNQGHFGKGDLILAVRIEEHKFFKRKGLDVYCEVPVNIVQAALGTKIRVKTINDKKVELNVPEGTQNGTVLKLRGLGLSKDNQKGDQYVTIRVETPSNLSEEQKELLKKFQKASK